MKRIGKSTILASEVKFGGAQMFTDAGELNAATKHDALKMLASLAQTLGESNIVTTEEASVAERQVAEAKNRRQVLAAAIADKTGETRIEVGQELAGTIYETVTKIGLMRQILQYADLNDGETARVSLERKNVTAVVMTGPTQARTEVVTDWFINPPEVDITARPIITNRRLKQAREDLLQRVYNETLEAILTGEDRMFKAAVDTMVDTSGQSTTHVGQVITPAGLAAGMAKITGWGLPLETIVFASNLWTGMALSREFEHLIDPVTRLEILRTGRMGSIMGAQLLTDAARDPRQKVLENNEIYFFSSPQYVGEYTDRGGVVAEPLGAAETGINGVGWHVNELVSVALINSRAVARTRLT